MEHARRADATDLAALAVMWEAAVAELDGQRGGALLAGSLFRTDPEAELAQALADPDRLVVAGLIDEVSVGLASVVRVTDRREPIGYLELLYVDPAARQVGVGEAMVDVVLDWCRNAGCVGVDAPSLPGNRTTKAFFEGHAFLARLLVMHYRLDHAP